MIEKSSNKKMLLVGAGTSKCAGIPDDRELLEKVKGLQPQGYFMGELIEKVIEGLKNKGVPDKEIGCEVVVNALWNWAKYDLPREHPMVDEYAEYDFDLPYWFKGDRKLFHMISLTNLAVRHSYVTIMQPTKTLEHWDPVIKVWDKGLTIVSLNYDTVIEKRCAELELAIDASIAGEKDLPRLLKLHGSIDWLHKDTKRIVELDIDNHEHTKWFERRGPAVVHSQPKVFPQIEFLGLYAEFQRRLAETSRVVVSGYSFRDRHVNYLLEVWRNERTESGLPWELTIVDPNNPLEKTNDEDVKNLLADLTWEGTEMEDYARIKYVSEDFGPDVAAAIQA